MVRQEGELCHKIRVFVGALCVQVCGGGRYDDIRSSVGITYHMNSCEAIALLGVHRSNALWKF
jgi:hypothetical protein